MLCARMAVRYGIRSEFAYYVPSTINRTVTAYRTWLQFLKRTVTTYRTLLRYTFLRAVTTIHLVKRRSIRDICQRWKPVGLPVGSRFFDWPVKPVEKPVKFFFLAAKTHLSIIQNILIYFIINETFYTKTVSTNHIFRKHLLNGFKLWLTSSNH